MQMVKRKKWHERDRPHYTKRPSETIIARWPEVRAKDSVNGFDEPPYREKRWDINAGGQA